jgi:hypothetical protein
VAVNHPPDGYAGSIPVSPTKPLPHDWIERGSSKNPRVVLVSGEDRKTPAEWLQTPEFSDIVILDPDGWDRSDPDDWQRPLTRTQFTAKMVRSTCTPRGRNPR